MDFALQKATELGVAKIQPLFTQRCVVKLPGKRLASRMEHWQKIIVNACEQSGRCLPPEIEPPKPFTTVLDKANKELRLLLDPSSQQGLMDFHKPERSVSLLVGPEGGLDEEENRQAQSKEFRGIKLGPRILRAETAPLAAIAAIQTLWGDFGCTG